MFVLNAFFCRESRFVAILRSKLRFLLRNTGVDSDFTQKFWGKIWRLGALLTWQAKPSTSSSLWCMSKETFLLCCSLVILVTISRVPSSDTSFFSRSFWTATNLWSVSSFTQADGLYLWNPQSSSESSSFLGAFQVRGGAPVAWKVNTTSKNRWEHYIR